ncbi:hypothetical protein VaNZ11_016732 [Volvox africanus]|uniref:NADP-dependent oxidoreductase domain-containing protein n=1 Tax=Volvox africanus TaxID=51714 RepID=A0ABQ5SQ54_9CHLO|nr:hypothetical protein VaNZ11_016732 [Volvox africanus]
MPLLRRHLGRGACNHLSHPATQLGRTRAPSFPIAPRPSIATTRGSSVTHDAAAACTAAAHKQSSPSISYHVQLLFPSATRCGRRNVQLHHSAHCYAAPEGGLRGQYRQECLPCQMADSAAYPEQQAPPSPSPLPVVSPLPPLPSLPPRSTHSVAVKQPAGDRSAPSPCQRQQPCGATAATPHTRRTAALTFAASTALIPGALMLAPTSSSATTVPLPRGGGSSGGGSGGRFLAQATSLAGQQQQQQQQHENVHQAGAGGDPGAALPQRRMWPPVPQLTLAPELRVSKVIRGCWQLSGRHKGDPLTDRTSGGDALTDLAAFHRAGITALDVADNYGPAELLAGQYLRLYPGNSTTTTIITKLSYLTQEDMTNVSRTMVEYAVRSSLVRLGRQRLDLIQLQWAEPVRHKRWLDVLKWLADMREEGLIGQLGVCNFAVPQLAAAVNVGVGVVSNQVQYSLIDRRPQLFMQKAVASYGIKLLAYGTVAGGLLADRYYNAPASKVQLDTASKQKYGLILRQVGGGSAGGGGGWSWMQEVLEATRTVAQRHGVSSSAVATAWVLHQPQVAAAIVGARNARHIRDMQAACALKLDDADLLDLDAVWEGVPEPPTSDVYVWERGGAW